MTGKRCPECGRVSFSARTRPPWPCPYCGAECFYTLDEADSAKEEKKLEGRINVSKATEGWAASLVAE